MGENGGAAFIVVYALSVVFVALPLMLGELAVGRAGGHDPTSAFARITQRSSAGLLGWLPTLVSCVTLAYYGTVAGWIARYFWMSLVGDLTQAPSGSHAAAFEAFLADPIRPVLWQALFMAATAAVVAAGVNAGIERLGRIVMPLLGALVVALAAYSLSLPGSSGGLAFLFVPDWSALARPTLYLAALGQALFSLGVGYGTLLTYGAYAREDRFLPHNAVLVAIADTVFALLIGIAVFGAVFAFGLDPARGPNLAFITLPQVFSLMPGGAIFATAFFALVLAAALTSAVGFLEVAVAALTNRSGMRRAQASCLLAGLIWASGLPAALSRGPLRSIRVADLDLLEAYDTFAGEVLLPLSTLMFALFIGWGWTRPAASEATGLHGWLGVAWFGLVRFVVPPTILALFIAALLAR